MNAVKLIPVYHNRPNYSIEITSTENPRRRSFVKSFNVWSMLSIFWKKYYLKHYSMMLLQKFVIAFREILNRSWNIFSSVCLPECEVKLGSAKGSSKETITPSLSPLLSSHCSSSAVIFAFQVDKIQRAIWVVCCDSVNTLPKIKFQIHGYFSWLTKLRNCLRTYVHNYLTNSTTTFLFDHTCWNISSLSSLTFYIFVEAFVVSSIYEAKLAD